jgi:carbonic anhydrase
MIDRRIIVGSFVAVLLASQQLQCMGRSWRDIPVDNVHETIDTSLHLYMQHQEMLYKSRVDTNAAQLLTPQSPATTFQNTPSTIAPSPSPSADPTVSPTGTPTISPSEKPSVTPSWYPTIAPTIDPFKDHIPPDNPDPWYFNYEGRTIQSGEVALVQGANGLFEVSIPQDPWGEVSLPPNYYWNEFSDNGFGPWKGVLQLHEPSKNQCTNGQTQSPIDVRENGAICRERHQIRSRPGNTQGSSIQKRIESNKLRLIYERRPCSNVTLRICQNPDPPHADFPHGWGGFADLLNIDVKIQSEHTLLNERFDAEMQIYHLHPGRRRVAAISVLIRATDDGYNYYFEEVIKAFRAEYNKNIAKCRRRLQRQQKEVVNDVRALESYSGPIPNFIDWAKNNSGMTSPDGEHHEVFSDKIWNPYHELLIPSIYFYRYDGSLTEPPCSEFVSWWVSDKPMVISYDQLDKLKTILFTNVDESCKKTGVQYHESVARPIQNTNNRRIWKCTSAEFGPDP